MVIGSERKIKPKFAVSSRPDDDGPGFTSWPAPPRNTRQYPGYCQEIHEIFRCNFDETMKSRQTKSGTSSYRKEIVESDGNLFYFLRVRGSEKNCVTRATKSFTSLSV